MEMRAPTAIAIALLALAASCSHDREQPPTTCSATPQAAPDPASATSYCTDFYAILCDRSFADCPAIGLGQFEPDVGTCRSDTAAMCATTDHSNEWYDGPCAGVCLGFLRGADCAVLLNSAEPQACEAATGSFPPDCISTITPGTFTDSIASGDPTYEGGHARTWCISFTAGQAVTIQTSTPIDTVLHLIGPSGAQIAENDDYNAPTTFASRIALTIPATGSHKIIVRGYGSFDTGPYDLTVSATP